MKKTIRLLLMALPMMLGLASCSSVDQAVVKPEQGAAFRAMLKSLDWGTDTTSSMATKHPTWMRSVRRWAMPV